MRHIEEIYLISITINEDGIGNQVETPSERLVFAEELVLGSYEFYNAATTGIRPTKKFELYTREYLGEDRLKHKGFTYRIIRTETKGEKTNLYCESVSADG